MNFSTLPWDEARSKEYDLCIAVCGYETRATYIVESRSDRCPIVVLDYGVDLHNYSENRKIFDRLGATRIDLNNSDSGAQLDGILESICLNSDSDVVRILFDISSCSRKTMADTLLAIGRRLGGKASVVCVYALSDFDAPPTAELPSHISEPVVGTLSGWSEDLSKPPCAVIGLGFEPGRALGCIDYLEIPEIRLFMPRGPDERFQKAVESANELLVAEIGQTNLLHYDVMDPGDAFEKLESLLFGISAHFRPVIIPLGPKIFSAVSIILAMRLSPLVCVWRTSSGAGEESSDRKASGQVSAFEADIGPSLYDI